MISNCECTKFFNLQFKNQINITLTNIKQTFLQHTYNNQVLRIQLGKKNLTNLCFSTTNLNLCNYRRVTLLELTDCMRDALLLYKLTLFVIEDCK